MTPQETKVKENKARRTAMRRLGLVLTKSNRRDDLAPDFGLFALVHPETGEAIKPEAARPLRPLLDARSSRGLLGEAKRRGRIISQTHYPQTQVR